MIQGSLSDALEAARHGEKCGSVLEVNSKRLLALNLRKLAGEELNFVPRCYILTNDPEKTEFSGFINDFKACQAFSVLKYVTTLEMSQHCTSCTAEDAAVLEPIHSSLEGIFGREVPILSWLPGPDPKQPISDVCVQTAIQFAERAVTALSNGDKLASLIMEDAEWEAIHRFSTDAFPCHTDLSVYSAKSRHLLRALPPECQLNLLQRNLWILKPSLNGGGNGRGILLLDRIPASADRLLDWVAAVGRGGAGGVRDALDGCLLQKLVEEPHLVSQQGLTAFQVEQGHNKSKTEHQSDNDKQLRCERLSDTASMTWPNENPKLKPGLFKYNFRLWVLASMATPPSVYLYRDSYIDLAAQDFTSELDPASHVTNLQRGHRTSQRYWPIPIFASYLQHTNCGHDLYHACILPQARATICKVFEALLMHPTSLLDKTSARLKRLGVDLLVDSNHCVWLMEFNVLRNEYGLKAAKGQEVKNDLAKSLLDEELKLKNALLTGCAIPETWDDLSSCIVASCRKPSMSLLHDQ